MSGDELQRYANAIAGHREDTESEPAARHVSDVMTTDVWAAREATPFKELARVLDRNHVYGVPVVDGDNHVLGVVTASDLLVRVAGPEHGLPRGHLLAAHHENALKRHALTAAELMTKPAITVTPTTPITAAAKLAAKSRVRTLPVVDALGRLLGVVTRDDMIRVFLRSDDDIRDDVEHDVVGTLPKVADNAVTVEVGDGVVTLRGRVTTALTAGRLVHDVERVPGVVDVRDELDYELDDAYLPVQW